jgi:hypothetical protein
MWIEYCKNVSEKLCFKIVIDFSIFSIAEH